MKFSLSAQISEINRELSQRAKVYPPLIAKGKLRKSEADYHVAAMTAVRDTLQWLSENELLIKQRLS